MVNFFFKVSLILYLVNHALANMSPTYPVYVDTVQTPDLKDLMTALYCKVASKWKAIAVQLKISDLASIERKHSGDPHLCLLEMLGESEESEPSPHLGCYR